MDNDKFVRYSRFPKRPEKEPKPLKFLASATRRQKVFFQPF